MMDRALLTRVLKALQGLHGPRGFWLRGADLASGATQYMCTAAMVKGHTTPMSCRYIIYSRRVDALD